MGDMFDEIRQTLGITSDMPESVKDVIVADAAGISVDWYRKHYKNKPPVPETPVADPMKRISAKKPRKQRTSPETGYWLYRMFGEDGALLYVGITEVGVARWRQHQREKEWFNEVRTFTVEQFPDRESVAEAELAAIRSECPKYNYTGVVR